MNAVEFLGVRADNNSSTDKGVQMARVFPTLQELDHLPTPLNIGERQVLDGLLHLDDDWLIYVQPRLGMDQPDFVVLNPRFGVTVIEVKDWSLDMYRQRSDGRIEVRHNESWRLTGEAPLPSPPVSGHHLQPLLR